MQKHEGNITSLLYFFVFAHIVEIEVFNMSELIIVKYQVHVVSLDDIEMIRRGECVKH